MCYCDEKEWQKLFGNVQKYVGGQTCPHSLIRQQTVGYESIQNSLRGDGCMLFFFLPDCFSGTGENPESGKE